jgi:DNA repair exonuclease SbcCD ATPase subunit
MANKTVAELQAEFDKVSRETQKAYDVLHPTFGSDARQIAYEYEKAVKEKDAKTIAELKPAYDAAQAKYADAQTRKNALRKELEAVKKEESAAKTKSISSKAAGNVYDKALKDLAVAEAKLGGYKGSDNYIAAYKNAQSAYDAAVAAGKTPVALPEAKIAIPLTPIGDQGGADGGKTTEKPLN